MTHPIPSPDGNYVSIRRADGIFARFPVDGGDPIPIPNVKSDERVCGWAPDGHAVYVFQRGKIPGHIDRIDLTTGERTPWIEREPMNRSGTIGFISVCVTPDGERYAASFGQLANSLFAVKGLPWPHWRVSFRPAIVESHGGPAGPRPRDHGIAREASP